MPEDIVKQNETLTENILKGQDILRDKNPDHPLLKYVDVDSMGIHYKEGFCGAYFGKTVIEGMNQYVEDLNKAIGK